MPGHLQFKTALVMKSTLNNVRNYRLSNVFVVIKNTKSPIIILQSVEHFRIVLLEFQCSDTIFLLLLITEFDNPKLKLL